MQRRERRRVTPMPRARTLTWSKIFLAAALAIGPPGRPASASPPQVQDAGPRVVIRGIYGGVPTQIFDRGGRSPTTASTPSGSAPAGSTAKSVELLKRQEPGQGLRRVQHDARRGLPQGPPRRRAGRAPTAEPCPPPDGWQGVCPTHPGYRRDADGGLPPGARATSRSTASGSTTTTPTRAGSRPSRSCPTPASATAAWPGSQRETGVDPSRSARRRSWPDALLGPHRAELGGLAVRGVHRLGARVPRRSATRSAPAPCWGRSTAPGRRTSAAGRCGRSWRST